MGDDYKADVVELSRVIKRHASGVNARLITRKKAASVKVPGESEPTSKSLSDDPFETLEGEVIEPPYDPAVLSQLPEMSIALTSAIEAMEVNIPGFGYSITSVFSSAPPPELVDEVEHERLVVKNNLDTFGQTISITRLRRDLRRDYERTGNSYLELIRNPSTGTIVAGKRIKSNRMRLLKQDEHLTECTLTLPRVNADRTIETMKVPHARRFRLFVECVTYAGSSTFTAGGDGFSFRYYKEFGDPRIIDNETGAVLWAPGMDKSVLDDFTEDGEPVPESRKASEIYHFAMDSGSGPYGVPRWIAALLSVLGARNGESANLTTIRRHHVPSMIVSVSNGRLTAGSIDRIETMVSELEDDDNFSKFLILEGEQEYEGEGANMAKISVTPLADAQIRDMLFSEYIANSESRIRIGFRLPPLYVGIVDGYNKSTATESRRLADEQVFAPERDEDDWFFNYVLFAQWNVKYHHFRTKTPNVTDNKDLVSMVVALERTGSMTPRIGRQVAIEVFPALTDQLLSFKSTDEGGVDPDIAFSMQIAERVKNQALATEVNQQIAPVMPGERVNAVKSASDYLEVLNKAVDAELSRFLAERRRDNED